LNFVKQINNVQKSWKAVHYDWMEEMKISDLTRMAGGKMSKIIKYKSEAFI
jgi:hypothetical protein